MRENNSVASSVCSIICYFFQHRWIFRWLTCIRSMKQVFPDKQGKRDVDVFIFQYSDSSVMEVHSCRASTATKGGWVDSKISRSAASGKKVHLHLCTPSDSMYGAGLNILFINATNYIILTTERINCINKNRNSFFPDTFLTVPAMSVHMSACHYYDPAACKSTQWVAEKLVFYCVFDTLVLKSSID